MMRRHVRRGKQLPVHAVYSGNGVQLVEGLPLLKPTHTPSVVEACPEFLKALDVVGLLQLMQ